MLPAVPVEERLAQPRPRRDHRAIPSPILPRIQHLELVRLQEERTERSRLQIVHQPHVRCADRFRNLRRLDAPGQVRRHDDFVDDRPGNSESRRRRTLRPERDERREDLFQVAVLRGRIRRLSHELETGRVTVTAAERVERKVRLRSTDVAGERVSSHGRGLTHASYISENGRHVALIPSVRRAASFGPSVNGS